MPTTPSLGITELTEGQSQKEVTINTAFETFDKALAGKLTKSVAGAVDVTLIATEWVYAMYEFTGNTTADIDIIVPTATRRFSVLNATTGPPRTITIKTATGTGVVLVEGEHMVVEQNGDVMTPLTAGIPIATDQGTFAITATGFATTVPTGTATYAVTGQQVTLALPELTGTSNAATFTLTGLPPELTPGFDGYFPALIQDNGVAAFGVLFLEAASDVMTIFPAPDALAGDWAITGTKQLNATQVSYLLA